MPRLLTTGKCVGGKEPFYSSISIVIPDLCKTKAASPCLPILDPPRDGVHPKALEKILAYGVKNIVYISCKPTSLVRDIELCREVGYEAERICCVDMFPGTGRVETVLLVSKVSL